MDRKIRIANKLCFDRDIKRSYEIHEDKLKTLKPLTDCKAPPTFRFFERKLKKNALDSAKRIQILKNNGKLFQRIQNIIRRPPGVIERCTSCRRVDLVRKKNLMLINSENEKMQQRIENQRSVYSVKRWQRERRAVEENINLICEYQYKDFPPNKTSCNLWATSSRKEQAQAQLAWNELYSTVRREDNDFFQVVISESPSLLRVYVEHLEDGDRNYELIIPRADGCDLLASKFGGRVADLAQAVVVNFERDECYVKYEEEDCEQSPNDTQLAAEPTPAL